MLVTDGGLETTLIFEQGLELPCFASFPLLEHHEGRRALDAYFAPYVELARARGLGFLVEATTWRANPRWGAELGYDLRALADANRRAITYAEEVRARAEEPGRPIPICAAIGSPVDAYRPERRLSTEQAAEYHAWQIAILADTAADLVKGATLAYVEEAIGIARAAAAVGIPAALSFTVETNGRLPSGQALADAINEVDAETDGSVAYFAVNCAHPNHLEPACSTPGPWHRILSFRGNASMRSHAELDGAAMLDAGDPAVFGASCRRLRASLPHLTVIGGCCGTDQRHVEAAVAAWLD